MNWKRSLGTIGLFYMIALGIVTLITWFWIYSQSGNVGSVSINSYGEIYIELVIHIIGIACFTIFAYDQLDKWLWPGAIK